MTTTHILSLVHRSARGGDKRLFDEATADLNTAIQLNSRNALPFVLRGYVRSIQNNLDQAVADFTHAIQFDPRYPNAYLQRAIAWAKKSDPQKPNADLMIANRLIEMEARGDADQK